MILPKEIRFIWINLTLWRDFHQQMHIACIRPYWQKSVSSAVQSALSKFFATASLLSSFASDAPFLPEFTPTHHCTKVYCSACSQLYFQFAKAPQWVPSYLGHSSQHCLTFLIQKDRHQSFSSWVFKLTFQFFHLKKYLCHWEELFLLWEFQKH